MATPIDSVVWNITMSADGYLAVLTGPGRVAGGELSRPPDVPRAVLIGDDGHRILLVSSGHVGGLATDRLAYEVGRPREIRRSKP
jgi:hypothetical protein